MINCEQALLVNLIELSPRNARRKFRQSIFESWEWNCAYCDKDLEISQAKESYMKVLGAIEIVQFLKKEVEHPPEEVETTGNVDIGEVT